MESTDRQFFPVPEIADLPGGMQSLFAKAEAELGFVPNVFRAYAHRPERFSSWFSHYRQLNEPTETLSLADREMIAVVVSNINGCTYCLVSHTHALRVELGDVVKADQITFNWRHAGLDDRQRAICGYVEKLTKDPATVERCDLEALSAAGLTDQDIWDVVELASMYAFTNRMSLAMGHTPNAEYHHHDRAVDTSN
ncbi:peroxidase-related enzyme [Rhodococcus tukisamuensis]|uniref:Uncharacterized peroxidase-related enzyme n=1 Tax=Rhodococcus tukisamuensis TaxID=168276 RepID=A0A1G6YWT8_9NOCA|nr:peroxidase-related enzyme [Rhodococcus tukisamuensis]SDD94800.1 uncharacterized peroxidase-related enzyme [Rhodococcus tukisamuensis]